jgi:hypothetical protein
MILPTTHGHNLTVTCSSQHTFFDYYRSTFFSYRIKFMATFKCVEYIVLAVNRR